MNVLGAGFVYDLEYRNPDGSLGWTEQVHNLIPQEGVDYVADTLLNSVAQVTSWYLGLFENDYAPGSTSTAAQLVTPIGETTAYDAATRLLWQAVYNGVGRLDNSAARAEFVFTADKTIYGGFLSSQSSKQNTAGTLLSIARFSSPRVVETGGSLRVLAGIDLIPSV